MTKLEKLITFLGTAAINNQTVNRDLIVTRFRRDPSYVVYFNGLRRNGAINPFTGRVKVTKITGALSKFRTQNRQKQSEYYQRQTA